MLKKTLLMILAAGLFAHGGTARGAERLKGEPSAFLQEFADSPVDWMPWGEAAFARAKAEQRPVFLFIGSFTSELAGAMRKQSFANPKNADWLNKQFVCVLVDRDERPDVAELYQEYVNTMKQVSGWPLNIWLTPEFQPYEGATYLSPSEDWGAPGFLKLANQAKSAWASSPEGCRRHAKEAVEQMSPASAHGSGPPSWNSEKAKAQTTASAAAWQAVFDPVQKGFGDAPRTLEPELIRFMLTQSEANKEAALATLRAVAASAVRDPLDGGFFRHAADAAWRIPYQQKVLSDQARFALAFLAASSGKDSKSFNACARGALDYAVVHLGHPDGSFASAEDATGEAYAGYFAWTSDEIDKVLGSQSEAFKAAHGVAKGGNVAAADDPSALFSGKNLLLSSAEPDPREDTDLIRLLAARAKRPRPPRDERATAGAHGLMVLALTRAGTQLFDAKYFAEARRTVAALRRDFLLPGDGLRRLKGSDLPGAAEDYAAVALGLGAFGRATNDHAAEALAGRLLEQLDKRFYDPAGGSYFGAQGSAGAAFFIRPAQSEDPPTAACLAIEAGDPHAGTLAASILESIQEASAQAPGDQLLGLQTFLGSQSQP